MDNFWKKGTNDVQSNNYVLGEADINSQRRSE